MDKGIRYIVFAIDDRISQYIGDRLLGNVHSGKIYQNIDDARDYAINSISENDCKRAVVGSFTLDDTAEVMSIHCVETFGFRHDKAKINQLELFK